MTILFVTEIVPFPVHGGERLRNYGLLRLLSEIADRMIAVIGKTRNESYKDYAFGNVEFHEFDFNSLQSKNRYVNYLSIFRKNARLLELLDKIITENRIDAVLIDYLFYGQYIQYFRSRGIPVIYDTHNVQSHYALQMPSETLRNKISGLIEYLAYYIHEQVYFRKADAIIAVSEHDSRYYKRYIPGNKVFVIPNFLIEKDYILTELQKGEYVIMTGQFGALQNITGLRWFLENIWSDESFRTKQLFVAGLGSDTVLQQIKAAGAFTNIKAMGSVDDLKPLIAAAKVSIVPLLQGSGTRLKCIESMALGTQLLSTTKGAEGIVHEGTIEIADTPETFIRVLNEILDGKIDHTEKAYEIFLRHYSLQSNLKIMKDIINGICHSSYLQSQATETGQ